MNHANNWSVVRQSATCQISNALGDFGFRAFELVDPDGRLQVAVTLFRGTLQDGILIRVNSGCMTGELFGDVSCDCSWQLARSLEMIVQEGSGLLIHAAFDEGRGTGIVNKVNSMSLMQTRGIPSSPAFSELKLPLDTRDFGYAGVILHELGLSAVRCITNNPRKVASLEQVGITVESNVEIVARDRPDLRNLYVDKVVAQGHRIDLSGECVHPAHEDYVPYE
jgi:GTP cyclohydrolase II